MAMIIKLPKALLQNQAAVITDRIEGGDCVNEKLNPGIESHISPSIISKNCGNCHNIDTLSLSFDWSRFSMFAWRIAAHKKDKTALNPPIAILVKGEIRMLNTNNPGITTFCHSGIKINRSNAPTALAWSASILYPSTFVFNCDAWNVQLESICVNNAQYIGNGMNNFSTYKFRTNIYNFLSRFFPWNNGIPLGWRKHLEQNLPDNAPVIHLPTSYSQMTHAISLVCVSNRNKCSR